MAIGALGFQRTVYHKGNIFGVDGAGMTFCARDLGVRAVQRITCIAIVNKGQVFPTLRCVASLAIGGLLSLLGAHKLPLMRVLVA